MAAPKPGRFNNPNAKVYMGPGKISPTNVSVAKPVSASTVAAAFKKSFKNPQFLPGEAADSVA